ncbi:type VII secretion integral membrane protein EccD [Plantactinospora sp. B5E13]|uniref:type VII secretion integral membrane protein EccD n=1 Tax=unclassified Plantactinospora TaxID=2631981 RepID=UPI00325CEE61
MAQTARLGLTRIVLLSPQRRADLSVPRHLPLVTLLPTLLRHGGNGLADEGIAHHGWVLRRVDGRLLDSTRSLQASGVVDGETLLLSPQDQHWPEPAFDDLAEAVGQEAKRAGATWNDRHTRLAGGAATALLLALGLLVAGTAGPPWTAAGVASVCAALLTLVGAVVVARMPQHENVPLVMSIAGYGYAVLGSVLLVTGAPRVGRDALVVGCATLLLVGVLNLIALRAYSELHLATAVCGLFGGLGTMLSTVTTVPAVAAGTALVLLLASPWLPRIALYQAGMPVPNVPRPAAEVGPDEPFPAPVQIAVLVGRGDSVLTGLLWGVCATLLGSVAVLAGTADLVAWFLAATVVLVCALRTRAFVAVRHRLPLLSTAGLGVVALAILTWLDVSTGDRARLVPVTLATALFAGAGAFVAGRTYAVRQASPQLGRVGDITEFVLISISAVLAAAVTGLFGYVRGLSG